MNFVNWANYGSETKNVRFNPNLFRSVPSLSLNGNLCSFPLQGIYNMSDATSNSTNHSTMLTAMVNCPIMPDFPMKVGFTALYSLIFLVAICGNITVVHFFRAKKRRNSFTLLVINLAACDILYACVIVPDSIHFFFYEILWFSGRFGEFSCKIWKFLLHLVVAESVATFLIIAIDRYLSIAHVRKQPMSRRVVCVAIVVSWIISSLVSSTEIYAYKLINKSHGNSICRLLWHKIPNTSQLLAEIDRNVKFILVFALPFLIIGFLYSFVIRFLWYHVVPGHQNQSNARARHVIKMLLTMVGTFVLAWLPVHVCLFLMMYDFHTYTCRVPLFLRYLFFCLAHANCAINPCMYLIFNKEYREDVKEVFNRIIWCCSSGIRRTVQNITPRPTGSFSLEQITPQVSVNPSNTKESVLSKGKLITEESRGTGNRKNLGLGTENEVSTIRQTSG